MQGRHEAIQKIERQVIELAQLFEDMNVLVVQQEPVVAQINERVENVQQNVTQGNTQLDGAIKKARAARRKKWYCLGIVCEYLAGLDIFGQLLIEHLVLIIIILAAVLGGYFGTR